MLKMKLCWSLILCMVQIPLTLGFVDFKDYLPDILKKPPKIPKIPGIPVGGIQIGSHVGGGSFGFGFGFGIGGQAGAPSAGGANIPPKEIPHPEKPETTWEEEKKGGRPRPNWEEDADVKPKPDYHDDKKDVNSEEDTDKKPKPDYQEDSKPMPYEEDNDDPRPDWEEIGEKEKNPKSDDLMDGDLVADGLIRPRLNRRRVKRLIDSKVYHVPLKFISNARPFKVQFDDHPNSLSKGNYI